MVFNWGDTTRTEKADIGTMKPSLKPSSMMQAEATAGAPTGMMTSGISISVTEAETLPRAREKTAPGRNRLTGTKKLRGGSNIALF